jgi:glutamine synthetase
MNEEPQATIRRQVAERAVERAQLWFTDDIGELEMVEIPSSRLDGLLDGEATPNNPSTGGYGRSAGSDIVAVPDWSTFKILPGGAWHGQAAAVFCSLTSMCFVALDQHALA